MKKIAILLFITSSFVFAQNTYVPDDKFEQALIDLGYDDTLDDYVLTANISGVTTLDVNNKEISDLTGIEAFTSLTALQCYLNKLTSLDVSNNTALTSLNLYGNSLTSLDISKNTTLTLLNFSENKITSIDLTNNTALNELNCWKNQLTNLDVSKNINLKVLNFYSNQLTSLDVSANTALTYLHSSENKLTSLDLSSNTALEYLHVGGNQLTSLDLTNNTALNELNCTNNQLTSLDVSANTALTKLQAYNNLLTSVDLSTNKALTYFSGTNNQLTTLDLSNNTVLDTVYCRNNQLTTIDVSTNDVLRRLNIENNKLTTLDVSGNKALTDLNCRGNQLTTLDVSKNLALTTLRFNNNQLASLDVSRNKALTTMRGNNNQLTYLNIRNGVKENLSINIKGNSSLTCIEVLDPAWATANWTSANEIIDAGVTFAVICGGTDLTTWHVDSTGSDGSGNGTSASPLATIQTGINAATDGDTVLVAAGTYKENIKLNFNDISIIGKNRETTIIDGDQKGTVVKFHRYHNHNKTVLSGFTITNGKGTVDEGGPWGGGIEINGAGVKVKPLLRDLIIENNTALNGAGIRLYNSASPNIENCIIRNNQAIYPDPSGKWVAGIGGGISADGYDGTMKNVLFAENSSESGGALSIFNGNTTLPVNIVNCTFVNNYSLNSSDIFLDGASTLHVTNTIIWDDILISQLNGTVTLNIDNSLIQGGYSGEGNIDVDPMFCDTTSYTLYATSPAVGAGENGVNMGAMGVGCDVPQAFEWVSSALDTINITKTNLTDTYTAQWTESKDDYGDAINYLVYAAVGVYPAEEIYDTTSLSVPITYQEILEGVFEGSLVNGATVRFNVKATDGVDTVDVTGENRVIYVNRYDYLSVEGVGIPTEFALHENYPNPFNPTTTLRFDLPEVSNITLTIFNMLGQKIRTYDMQSAAAGYHTLKWNATNDYGDPVGAGVYLYQLQTKDFVKTRKMVLLK